MPLSLGAEAFFAAERNMSRTVMRGTAHPAGVEEHITREKIASEPGRSRVWPSADEAGGPHREGEEPKPMMHGGGKSDEAIVARKSANKAERSAAEPVERRAEAKGNAGQHSTYRAQNRSRVSQALVRIRRRSPLDPRWEPYAGKPHVRICAGGAQQWASLPRPRKRVPAAQGKWRARAWRFARPTHRSPRFYPFSPLSTSCISSPRVGRACPPHPLFQ
jgi:hypothetical protein